MSIDDWKGVRVWSHNRPGDPENAHLGGVDIEIEDLGEKVRIDPNAITTAFIVLHHPGLENSDEGRKILADRKVGDAYRLLANGPRSNDVKSIISGEPAIYYRTDEITLPLTVDEMKRLVLRALTKDEFEAIVAAVGAIYELHFYDPDTGEATQPKIDVPGKAPLVDM